MSYQQKVTIGDCTLYQADCAALLPTLGRFDAVITDPPYGLGEKLNGSANRNSEWRKLYSEKGGFSWDKQTTPEVLDLPGICTVCIVWGGNYYSLPSVRGWLIWDKVVRKFSSGHCEMAWTNIDQPIRAFNFTNGELATEGKVHPTQKPLALMRWCIEQAGSPQTILDPFAGSGTTGVATVQMGRKFTGIEKDERYFAIAVKRIEQAYAQGQLFQPERAKQVQAVLV